MSKQNQSRQKTKPFKGAGTTNARQSFHDLIKSLSAYLPAMLIALLLALIGVVLQIVGPNQLIKLTDAIMQGLPRLIDGVPVVQAIDFTVLWKVAWVLIVLYSGSSLLSLAQGLMMTTITQRFSKGLRTDISDKINRLPLRYFDQTTHGDVLSRVTNDVDTVSQALNQSVSGLVTAIALFIGSGFMMFYHNWLLAVTAIVSSLLGFGLMAFIMNRSQNYFRQQQQDLGVANGHVEEFFSGQRIVQAYNAGPQMTKRFDKINQNLYESGWKSQFLSGLMQPLMGFIGNFGYVAVCVVGAALTMQGVIAFSVIVAFMVYIRLFTQPLTQMAQAFQRLQQAAAAGERVFDFLKEEEQADETDKTALLNDVQGNVDFQHVSFGYRADHPVIHDFSASVKAGQKVAIVGPTGAGKTTLVNLLMRFYEVDAGEILIDGMPISEVPRENVREQFGMVLQDTWLFEGTIRENISYGKENTTDEDIIHACRTVGLHYFITTLPQGYDTILDDRASLSQGQKQLLTIARAMIQNAPMLILDEATSSVDTRTEALIQKAMETLTVGRTSFVIAHRLSTIRNADLILVMRDGDIVERGRHAELLANGNFYADLYNSQFEPASEQG